jgi:hypothetical protein
MAETIITATIMVSSILLLGYWFRFTCHLILSAATSQDYATNVARAHQLCYLEAQRRLTEGEMQLGLLKEMLDRDYDVVARLLGNVGGSQAGIERRMLEIHYSVMGAWYQVSSRISTSAAHAALEEMSNVVAYFANSVGEAAASPA